MTLRLKIEGNTAELLIDRPEKKNAFTQEMWEALPLLLDEICSNPNVHLVILRAATDGAFCAGADIGELLANKDDAGWLEANQKAINQAQYRLARLELPSIAFINGACFGGGCGLALACDIRIATPAAKFAITPAKLGLVYPLHDINLLVDLVGPGQASRILFGAETLSTQEALDIGLIEQIADTPNLLANSILANSPASIRHMKSFIRRVRDGQNEDNEETRAIFASAFSGDDFSEGTRAFLEKRIAKFNK